MKRDRRQELIGSTRRPRGADGRRTAHPGEKSWTEYHKGRRVAVEAAPRMRIHAERRKQAIKRAFLGTFAALVLLSSVAAASALIYVLQMEGDMTDSPLHKEVLKALTPPKKEKPAEPFTVLLMGNDKRPGEKTARADTMIVARVDPKTKQIRMVSIPRDSRVEIPGHGIDKINAAAFYGGPALTVDTIEEYMGVPINHYMMVDFKGFQKVVDAMGGVWIDVDVEIDDEKAASHGKRRAKHIDPGYQLLDGEHALTYCRSREFPDGDFTRMRHQQTFFKSVAKQSLKLSNVLKLPGIMKVMAKHTDTDLKASEILALVQAMRGIGEKNVQTATLTGPCQTIGGVSYVVPDESEKERLAEALRTGGDLEQDSSGSAAEVVPSSVSVTVRNGAGVSGCAADTAAKLEAAGYDVGEVGNANQFVYDTTLVVYKDGEAEARSVASALGVSKVVASRGMYSFTSDVLVVVGKDWSATPSTAQSSAGARRD